jgi:hypothetical protein
VGQASPRVLLGMMMNNKNAKGEWLDNRSPLVNL